MQKVENRDIILSKSNHATNQTFDKMLRTLEENENNILLLGKYVNQSGLSKMALNKQISEKLGMVQRQQKQVVNGFNNNAILQNKIF